MVRFGGLLTAGMLVLGAGCSTGDDTTDELPTCRDGSEPPCLLSIDEVVALGIEAPVITIDDVTVSGWSCAWGSYQTGQWTVCLTEHDGDTLFAGFDDLDEATAQVEMAGVMLDVPLAQGMGDALRLPGRVARIAIVVDDQWVGSIEPSA